MDKRVGEYRYTNIKTSQVGAQLCNGVGYSYRTDGACQFFTETYQDTAHLARQLDKTTTSVGTCT